MKAQCTRPYKTSEKFRSLCKLAACLAIALASSFANAQSGDGLLGEYFDNENLTGMKFTRVDPNVNFNWQKASPDPRIAPESFSIRWTGSVLASATGTHTFITIADDGVRLWVDGRLLIDDWKAHATTEKQATISLVAGRRYNIKLEYFDRSYDASVGLLWSSPTFNRRPIPQEALFSAAAPSSSPTPKPATPTPSPTPVPQPDPYAGERTRTPDGKLLVIPGVQGFGVTTPAGRNGQILRVTKLADDGTAGTLRWALAQSGPRIIVFETSGTIRVTRDIAITNPYVTIAGQTAPSPGINIRGAAISIQTHDVLMQHIRIRTGNDPEGPVYGERDGLQWLGNVNGSSTPRTYNVVVDHCSIAWGTDENVQSWYPGIQDITFSNSITSEGLMSSSRGLLVGDYSYRFAIIGNLFAHNDGRNPLFKGATSGIVINNYIYNPGYAAFEWDAAGLGPILTSVQGNVFEKGANTKAYLPFIGLWSTFSGSKLYYSDNLAPGSPMQYGAENVTVSQPPISISWMTALPASQVKASVLKNAGARPLDRDSVDQRAVRDAQQLTGRFISSPSEVGGYPNLAVNKRAFVAPSNPNGDDDSDGYTNVEEVLQRMSAALEGR